MNHVCKLKEKPNKAEENSLLANDFKEWLKSLFLSIGH